MSMMTSQILKPVVFTKPKNLDISRKKHYFKNENSLITHHRLPYGKK